MALVSKYSSIMLLPILASILGFCCFFGDRKTIHLRPGATQAPLSAAVFQSAAVYLFLFLAALVIVPLAYGFQGIQPWFFGFYRFLSLTQAGQAAFFLGEVSYEGWWNYFIVAFLIKTPIGSLAAITASLIFCRSGIRLRRREAIFLLTPVVLLFLALSQTKVNIGVRHLLPVYPFLFVLASRLATFNWRRCSAILMFGAPLLTAFSALRVAPHQLAYFNEFVGGPGQGYRYLGDSNLDWGQDLKGLKAYMEKEKLPIIYLSYFGTAPPSYYGIRYQYVPGSWPLEWPPPADKVPETAPRKILAISAYNLQGVSNPHLPLFRWLSERQPVAKIGYSIFVYDLSNDEEGLLRLKETYQKAGIALSGEVQSDYRA
jgi:hypothetical protein